MFEMLTKSNQNGKTESLFSAVDSRGRTEAQRVLTDLLKSARKGGGEVVRMRITPALAEILLEKNVENRALSTATVDRYAGAMTRGEWALNGQTIILSKDGELNDGQHRLHACVKSGRLFETFVAVGVDRETRTTLDQGRKRTIGDILHMSGESDANNLGRAAGLVWQYQTLGRISKDHPTPQQIEDLLIAHPDLRDSLTFGRMVYQHKIGPNGLFTALHFILAQRDKKLADDFMKKLATGVGITSRSSPLCRLRNRLIENAVEKRKISQPEIAALTIKAWNAVKDGVTSMRQLSWRSQGDAAEPFPTAR